MLTEQSKAVTPLMPAKGTVFEAAQASEDALQAQREHDRKIDLLITPKGHQRLRAFGYEVVKLAEELPPSTSDRRSL